MKKFTAILAVLMLTLSVLVPLTGACAGDDEAIQYYIVTENGLTVNLRSRPEGSLITRLGVGKPVTLISDDGSGWTKISAKVDGEILKGYVMSEFLTDVDPTELPQTFEDVRRFTVTVSPSKGEDGHINLRSEPTVNSVCLRYLHKDDVLTVIAESNAWYKVRTALGTTGYVVKAFVTK
ncbi:MAG: SH3 domain-containing protein [Clostridia bacterium]|nr:SH3 domain-containing protein [Clostridia bacterium]